MFFFSFSQKGKDRFPSTHVSGAFAVRFREGNTGLRCFFVRTFLLRLRILHIRMSQPTAQLQGEAIGVLGILVDMLDVFFSVSQSVMMMMMMMMMMMLVVVVVAARKTSGSVRMNLMKPENYDE